MPVEVAANEFMNLLFRRSVQVLELVHSLEFDDVETIGQNAVWLALEQVLRLVSGNMRDCGENIGAMRRRSLNTVAMVDPAFSGLVIDVEVL